MHEQTKRSIPKWHFVLVGAVIIVAMLLQLWPDSVQTERYVLAGKKIDVEVAETLEQQFRGLGGREDIGSADAMLFPFAFKGKHGFVMRDMQFAIDIVWLNDGVVVDIAPNVQPESFAAEEHELTVYTPRDAANAVLEFEAGWVKKHDLKIGDTLTLKE